MDSICHKGRKGGNPGSRAMQQANIKGDDDRD